VSEYLWSLVCAVCGRKITMVYRGRPTTRIPCARCGAHRMKAIREGALDE
jgi:hypothetical protein